jgi:hypothetical protein
LANLGDFTALFGDSTGPFVLTFYDHGSDWFPMCIKPLDPADSQQLIHPAHGGQWSTLLLSDGNWVLTPYAQNPNNDVGAEEIKHALLKSVRPFEFPVLGDEYYWTFIPETGGLTIKSLSYDLKKATSSLEHSPAGMNRL